MKIGFIQALSVVDFVSDSRAREFARMPRVAPVAAASSYHPPCARLFVADAVAAVDTSHHLVAALRSSIYAIQRCAMPFTGENMKTPLCVSRRCSHRFSSLPPPLPLPGPDPPSFLFAFGYMFIICFRVTHKFPRFSR